MTVIVDILHPAHINFFKNVIKTLEANGIEVIITVLNRGKVPKIVKKELAGRKIFVVGRHRGTKYSILVEANLLRFFKMFPILVKYRPKIGFSVGSFVMGTGLKLLGRKNYQVDDDPERFWNVLLEKLTSNRLYFPPGMHAGHPKVTNFNCLKEWAYLSPKYFVGNESALIEYNLSKGTYVFIREVSTGSLNYMGQAQNPVATISNQFPPDVPVVLSLEDKSTRDQYPSSWIILQEPVEDIHSLMYYSKCVISSGDSMAREGGMLGVPSIYCGSREMQANKILMDKDMLMHLNVEQTLDFVLKLSSNQIEPRDQQSIRNQLMDEWDDINLLLLKQIEADLKIPLNKPSVA